MDNIAEQLKQLDEWELLRWYDSLLPDLYPILRGGVFHRTGIKNYHQIKRDGFIFPNTGKYQFTYESSKRSFAFHQGYISLFDFIQPTVQQCIITCHNWEGFFCDQKPVTVVFKLNSEKLADKMKPNSIGPPHKQSELYLPFVEAWYPDPIPFSFTDKFICSFHSTELKKKCFKEFGISRIAEFEAFLQSF